MISFSCNNSAYPIKKGYILLIIEVGNMQGSRRYYDIFFLRNNFFQVFIKQYNLINMKIITVLIYRLRALQFTFFRVISSTHWKKKYGILELSFPFSAIGQKHWNLSIHVTYQLFLLVRRM